MIRKGRFRKLNLKKLKKSEFLFQIAFCLYRIFLIISKNCAFIQRIIEKNGDRTPLTYNQFQCIIESMDRPPVAEMEIPMELLRHATTPLTDDHEDRFGVPTLDELGR